ncbi:MAG: homoserine kinase, partial [Endomicrobia bacterium]|nr:homoserine kinase [Endomicrobiia bacterium]
MKHRIKIKVPATTANLGPGFDCLGAALSLYNEFEVKVLPTVGKKINVFVEGIDADYIPKDEKNHFYHAMKKIFQKVGTTIPSLEISIKNNIPLQRGLGSSATAYVAGVVAGNILCGEPLSEYELINIAAELEGHPDNVVPCMFGGLCVTTLVEGEVKFVKLNPPKDLAVLIIIPEEKIATEKARKVLPEKVSFVDAVKNVSNVSLLVAVIVSKKYEFLKFATVDFLHQPYRKKLMPWIDNVFNTCLENKALCCMLSGSGS